MEPNNHKLVRLIQSNKYTKTTIAKLCLVTRNKVRHWSSRISELEGKFTNLEDLSEKKISELINPKSNKKRIGFLEPNWEKLRLEIIKKQATGKLLYEEYLENAPEGAYLMSLSQFYIKLNGDKKKRGVEMSFIYAPGEQVQFDFVGKRPNILFEASGEPIRYEVGVSVSSQSRMIFAKAIPSQATEHSIHFLSDMLEFYGGVPSILVVDNFKAAVIKARTDKTEAVINPRFQACADYYGFAVSPARSRKPRDKGLVENSVRQVQMAILHKLRHMKFSTLTELNEAISKLLADLNNRPMKGHGNVSRKALFEGTDRRGYLPLQHERYVDGEWFLNRTVRSNLTFEAGGSHYSVPERFIHEKVNAKLSSTTVFVFFENKEIATHIRNFEMGKVIFKDEHRPATHQFMVETSLSHLIDVVSYIGKHAICFMRNKHHVNSRSPSSRKAAWGIVELADEFGCERTNWGCMISNKIKSTTLAKLRSIIASPKGGSHEKIRNSDNPPEPTGNIRGATYYNNLILNKEKK